MSVHGSSATRPATLRANIRAVERRIRHRRNSIGVVVRGIASNVRNRLISPSTLIAAGLFGATLHRGRRLHGLRLLAILQAANAGLRRLLMMQSRTRDTLD